MRISAVSLWCLPKYVKIDDEGPSESFFETSNKVPLAGVVGGGGAGQGGGADNNNNPNLLVDDVAVDDVELPATLQRMMDNPSNMDNKDIWLALTAVPMVDNDNAPAPKNVPHVNDGAVDIMIGWQHSGVCQRRASVRRDVKPEPPSMPPCAAGVDDITNLQIFELLFFSDYLCEVIIPSTNKKLEEDQEPLTYGEFLQWLGLWLLMATIIGPPRHEFWSTLEINAFQGTHFRLGIWMS